MWVRSARTFSLRPVPDTTNSSSNPLPPRFFPPPMWDSCANRDIPDVSDLGVRAPTTRTRAPEGGGCGRYLATASRTMASMNWCRQQRTQAQTQAQAQQHAKSQIPAAHKTQHTTAASRQDDAPSVHIHATTSRQRMATHTHTHTHARTHTHTHTHTPSGTEQWQCPPLLLLLPVR